tara:strand:- start:9531 stop:10163 length:633 start_codon:yes stop_codon:yes gene_type:complete
MPTIKIPEIKIPTIDIPESPFFIGYSLTGLVPGCHLYHRDLEVSRNPSLLWADINGVSNSCPEGQVPSYEPMRYDPHRMTYTETTGTKTSQKPTDRKQLPKSLPRKKDEEEIDKPCPDPNSSLRIGSFANEKRLERVSKFEVINGDCLPVWEKVTYAETYFPSPGQAMSTTATALLAVSAPLILNLIKPIVKNLIKKITGKKEEKKSPET